MTPDDPHQVQQEMRGLWDRFTRWIKNNCPDLLAQISPGATEEAIRALEQKLGIQLPVDVKAFYQYHDGQVPHGDGFIDTEELLSLKRIQDEWMVWHDLLTKGDFEENGRAFKSAPQAGIKNDWWNPKWIPFTYDGNGNHLCLDLDPAPTGKVGQIIRMWHDDAERELIAPSFQEFITSYVHALETEEFVYDDEFYGGIIRKAELLENN